MAATTYAKIQAGVVVNTQVVDPDVDALDPAFVWVPIAGITCLLDGSGVEIGCTYDGSIFIPAD